MADTLALKGSIGGFAFDLRVEKIVGSDDELLVTGTAGSDPANLVIKVDEDADTLTISGMLLGKECIVNGHKHEA